MLDLTTDGDADSAHALLTPRNNKLLGAQGKEPANPFGYIWRFPVIADHGQILRSGLAGGASGESLCEVSRRNSRWHGLGRRKIGK